LSDEAVWEDFARNTVNLIRCGKAQAFTEHIVSLPEFSSFEKMLDMGAGPGVLGISVAGAHPSAECVLMDRASVCVVADEVIKEYGMESRVKTMAGDYTSDPLGEDYDLIIASHTLNFYSGSFDKLMAKVLAALKPGGVFIVFGDGLNREKTAPETSVISWLSASLMHTDLSFGVGVIDDAMLKAGFVSTQSFVESRMTGHGPTVVTVGRKKKG